MNCSFHRKEQRYLTSRRDHALSFGFSYDFPQESTGLFQIFILPRNFQPFRANSRSAFVWRVAIVSQLCIYAISTQTTAGGFWSKQICHEGCNERIIVPPDTQRIKSPGFQIAVISYFNSMMNIYGSSRVFAFLMTQATPMLETANPVQTVQLSVNRLRIFKQLKRVRSSLLLRFRYAVIICTWRKPRF